MDQFKVAAFLIGNSTLNITRLFNLNNTKKRKRRFIQTKMKTEGISELLQES